MLRALNPAALDSIASSPPASRITPRAAQRDRTQSISALAIMTLLCARCSQRPAASDTGVSAPRSDTGVDAQPPSEVDASSDAPEPDVASGPRRVVITSTGSIVLHRHVVQMAQSYRELGGLSHMLSRLAPIITAREVALVPLEGPLTSAARTPWVGDYPALGGHPWMARQLARVGFDAVILATNHAFDQRPEGLEATIESVEQAQLGAVGAGRSEEDAYTPWTTERDGVRVAVLGYAERSAFAPGGADARAFIGREVSRVLEALRQARTSADVVVLCAHWGRDRSATPTANQRALARRFIDAGADLVLGAGPTVLQPVERMSSDRGDAVVAYSLGTLLSNFGSAWHAGIEPRSTEGPMAIMYDPRTRDGALLRVQFEVPEAGRVALVSMSAVATWTINFSSDLRVTPMRHADDRVARVRMPAITAALGQAVRVRP